MNALNTSYVLVFLWVGLWIWGMSVNRILSQSLSYNQTIVLDVSQGLATVPQNKTWKIVNAVNAPGQMTVSGAVSTHCGSTCGGGWCGESSCFYVGHLFELNGTGLNPSNGCHYCGVGSPCSNGVANCPATHTFTTQVVVNFPSPFWLKSGNTLQVNAGNLFFSIIEFNIVP